MRVLIPLVWGMRKSRENADDSQCSSEWKPGGRFGSAPFAPGQFQRSSLYVVLPGSPPHKTSRPPDLPIGYSDSRMSEGIGSRPRFPLKDFPYSPRKRS